jgi:hypothetical protein
MKICSRLSVFLAMFGWSIAGGFMYGGYPPPKTILAHLVGNEGNGGARFKRLFYEVLEETKKNRISGQSDPRKLVGEERNLIALPNTAVSDVPFLNTTLSDVTLSDISLSEKDFFSPEERDEEGKENANLLYVAGDEHCWLRRYFADGDFLIKIDGLTVQKSEDIDELMQSGKYRRDFTVRKKNGCWKDEWYPKLSEVFKTLASEIFMRKLLGDATVRAFYDQTKFSRSIVYVFCYPWSDGNASSTVLFSLMYRQETELWLGFNVLYDMENERFTDNPVALSAFRVGTYRIGTKNRLTNDRTRFETLVNP